MSEEKMEITSHRGRYAVVFDRRPLQDIFSPAGNKRHYIIDKKVARLYEKALSPLHTGNDVLLIEAAEENKSLDRFVPYVEHLVTGKIRRDHTIVAIGGGIIQDITCFLATTMLRGIEWEFYPTTLLAQADSCIGSKSSINVGQVKNILGTFNPPRHITISTEFLNTLEERDLLSGVGEMLKVHVIDGAVVFDTIASDYDAIFQSSDVMERYIHRSLEIKKDYIEKDEFDQGIRNIFNYGHSFGHALEAATHFGIPHGVAVTIGMDLANYTASRRGLLPKSHYQRMHDVLARNYAPFRNHGIPLGTFFRALSKDKKNIDDKLVLILPVGDLAEVQKVTVDNDPTFQEGCRAFFEEVLRA